MAKLTKGLREMRIEEVTEELADTTTGTSGVSQVIGEEWEDRVLRDAEAQRRFRDLSRENEELVNAGGDTVHLPISSGHLGISATGTGEGSDRTFTKLDTLSTVDVTISTGSNGDFYKGGIALSKESVMTSNVDLMDQARHHISEEIAQDLDIQVLSQIESDTPSGHNIDQTNSGELTPDAISSAMQKVEEDNYVPRFLVISPAQQHDLRTDSQFTNASEYGNREVIANGEIGEYLGLRVIKSTNIGNATANTKAVLIGETRSGEVAGPVVVWKEMPNIGQTYDEQSAEHRMMYNQAFAVATLQSDSLATIQTA